MKALIIGVTGYIGSAIAERILSEGWSVIGSTRSPEAFDRLIGKGIQPHLGSLEEPESLKSIISQADAVIYSAYGYNSVEAAVQEISSGASHISWMLKELSNTGRKFILTSGSGVFPDTGDIVFTEDTPFPPSDSPVTIARRNLEIETQAAAIHGVHSIVLRPPTVYGRGGSFIVPRFLLDHALNAGQSVFVEGTENNKWSAVHIDDLADLYVLAMKKAHAGSLFNTGAESGIPTSDIATSISRAAGLGGTTKSISADEARKIFGHWGDWWGINNQCSGEKARTELSWNPHRSPMLQDIEHGSYAINVPSHRD